MRNFFFPDTATVHTNPVYPAEETIRNFLNPLSKVEEIFESAMYPRMGAR